MATITTPTVRTEPGTAVAFRTQYRFRGDPSEVGTINDEESMTTQSDMHDTDINLIMKRYGATGQMPRVQGSEAQYGDFSEVNDYKTALDSVIHAKEEFQKLPAAIRARFGNDPANLLQFVGDEANRTEAEKLGLLQPKPEPAVSFDTQQIINTLKEQGNAGTNTGAEDTASSRKKQRASRTDE